MRTIGIWSAWLLAVVALATATPTSAQVTEHDGTKATHEEGRMSGETNKALVHRLNEAIDRGDLDTVKALLSPNFVGRFANDPPITAEQFLGSIGVFREAFPDFLHEIKGIVAEGDVAVSRVVFTGTHKGSFKGIAPTGKRFTLWVTYYHRIVDGEIVEYHVFGDNLSLMQQLGALPSTPPPPSSR